MANGTYQPLWPIFIYVNVKSISRPEVDRFVTFYLQAVRELSAERLRAATVANGATREGSIQGSTQRNDVSRQGAERWRHDGEVARGRAAVKREDAASISQRRSRSRMPPRSVCETVAMFPDGTSTRSTSNFG